MIMEKVGLTPDCFFIACAALLAGGALGCCAQDTKKGPRSGILIWTAGTSWMGGGNYNRSAENANEQRICPQVAKAGSRWLKVGRGRESLVESEGNEESTRSWWNEDEHRCHEGVETSQNITLIIGTVLGFRHAKSLRGSA